jgi:hypothetical protein
MLRYTRLERLIMDQHSSLIDPFLSCEENEVLLICHLVFWKININIIMIIKISWCFVIISRQHLIVIQLEQWPRNGFKTKSDNKMQTDKVFFYHRWNSFIISFNIYCQVISKWRDRTGFWNLFLNAYFYFGQN